MIARPGEPTAGTISAVLSGSFAERVELRAGDQLLSVNGTPVRDVIDVLFYASEPVLRLRIRRDGREHLIENERREGEPLGLEFRKPIFDCIRPCNNRCEFCFVSQMPSGLRSSLYLKDDDYRLSFLSGTYITLTNLAPSDWDRIAEQHLSPLYVSVHATEPCVRRRLLGNPAAPDVMAQLARLTEMGIEIHTQIVVRPGHNDGVHLDRSVGDLVRLYPGVTSVSIVPVGLTKHHSFDCRLHIDGEVRVVVGQIRLWQDRLRRELGVTFAHLSDEWYLRAGEDVPPLDHYDGLDLTENGVGLVRQFLTNADETLDPLLSDLESPTFVTGTLFAPVLRSAVAGLGVEVVPVVNQFFGESVTVAGLLTGEDVIAQLKERDSDGDVVLPAAMFGGPEGQSLDEMWPADVQDALDREVVLNTPSPILGRPAGSGGRQTLEENVT